MALVKDDLAMRLTFLGNRLALMAALMTAIAPLAGCRRAPYIDQSKVVPHEPVGMAGAPQDDNVQQAQFLDRNLPMQLPKIADPRTSTNPEAEEIWELTLPEAIRIGLDNSEVVRVIALGAGLSPQVGQGFEPSPLNTGAGAGGPLGAGALQTVYDPGIQETQIAQALSQFDANLSTTLFWNRNVSPFNNAISSGVFLAGSKFPVVFRQEQGNLQATLQKRLATGAVAAITQNVIYNFTNSPTNVFPSAYTPNLQLNFTQPLLGSAPTSQFNPNPNPVGVEANRAPIVVARLNADISVWRFKGEVMAMVRSIEQAYWNLAQAQVQYWASETAVDLGEKIYQRERARYEVGSSSLPNVAEAAEQLERFKLDFVDKTTTIINSERQLRNILGLPPSDHRRIVPATEPTDARLEPDWESNLAQMISYHPDIVQQQILVRVAELQLLIARNQLLPVLNLNLLYQFNGYGHHLDEAMASMTGKTINVINPLLQFEQRNAGLNPNPTPSNSFQTWQIGLTFQVPLGYRGPLANVRQAQYALLRQRAFLQQTVHQTTHAMSRYTLDVDINYKAYKTASRLKEAALQRLEAQRAYFEIGQITIDRYLDAVNRWANAVAIEAQHKNQYNVALVLLEETKGTLLGYNNIALAEGPWPAKAYVQARDIQNAHNQHPVGQDGPYKPFPITGPPNASAPPAVTPPGIPERPPLGPYPAPIGPLGPAPVPAPPMGPSGDPTPLTSRPRELRLGREPEVQPATNTVGMPRGEVGSLPALPAGNAPPDEFPKLPDEPK